VGQTVSVNLALTESLSAEQARNVTKNRLLRGVSPTDDHYELWPGGDGIGVALAPSLAVCTLRCGLLHVTVAATVPKEELEAEQERIRAEEAERSLDAAVRLPPKPTATHQRIKALAESLADGSGQYKLCEHKGGFVAIVRHGGHNSFFIARDANGIEPLFIAPNDEGFVVFSTSAAAATAASSNSNPRTFPAGRFLLCGGGGETASYPLESFPMGRDSEVPRPVSPGGHVWVPGRPRAEGVLAEVENNTGHGSVGGHKGGNATKQISIKQTQCADLRRCNSWGKIASGSPEPSPTKKPPSRRFSAVAKSLGALMNDVPVSAVRSRR